MKRMITFFVVAMALGVAASAVAQDAPNMTGRMCSPAGTWIGGGDAAKYMMNLVPMTPWRYTSVAQGSYLPSETGNAAATNWTGEIVRRPFRQWKGWAVQVASSTGVLFPDPANITIGAVKSVVEFQGCDTMIVTIDFFEIYFWDSIYGPDPSKELLVDPGDIPAPPTPIVEVYHRVSSQ